MAQAPPDADRVLEGLERAAGHGRRSRPRAPAADNPRRVRRTAQGPGQCRVNLTRRCSCQAIVRVPSSHTLRSMLELVPIRLPPWFFPHQLIAADDAYLFPTVFAHVGEELDPREGDFVLR